MFLTQPTVLGFFCIFACASVGQCAFSDDVSLIQDTARVKPDRQWPDIGKIIDKAKQAADSAAEAAEKVNSTIQNTVDQAANATKTAIQTIVTTTQTGLQSVLQFANLIVNNTEEAIDGFLRELQNNSNLETFEQAGIEILEAFNMSYTPLVLALNSSTRAIQGVLNATGFLHLSQEVGKDFKIGMMPLNALMEKVGQLKDILQGLDAKMNKTAGKITSEIDKDLKEFQDLLQEAVEEVNTTFIDKVIEGYTLLVSHLRATVEGVLPEEYLHQVNASLNSLEPVVTEAVTKVALPASDVGNGFDQAITHVRESVPASAHSATGISLLSLFISIYISCLTL